MSHIRYTPVPEYQPIHLTTATAGITPAGQCVATTASTTVAVGSQTVTPASMANIVPGLLLNVSGGTGTAEDVRVYSTTSTTFIATFANSHSGTYNLISEIPTAVGPLVVNAVGSGVTITLYNGHPNLSHEAGTAFAVITPAAGASYLHGGLLRRGLFYTVAVVTTAGDFTLWYLDETE